MSVAPVVSVIIDAFWRADLLRHSIRSVSGQTHEKLEIILIDNGAEPAVKACLDDAAASDPRVSLIRFAENQYSEDDPMRMVDVCLNAGLERATGDFVWYQSYDDHIASDYLERMVKLFAENSNCTSAAGLPVSVDADGNRLEPAERDYNLRGRYVHGRDIALDSLRGGKMFAAPGTIFTLPRELLVQAGGYHRSVEDSHMFGIVAFGESGFDEKAESFWRRHSGQLNRQINATGRVFTAEHRDLLESWDIEGRWQIYGAAMAREVIDRLNARQAVGAAGLFAQNFSDLRFAACWRTFRMLGPNWLFWKRLPGSMWIKRRQFASNLAARLGLRKPLRRVLKRNV